MCKIVAITGGIGSGKSTIANMFSMNGISVYISDNASREILELKETIDEIVSFFGTDILENEKINRNKLANIVFNDKDSLNKLNSIIHPKVSAHFKNWLLTKRNELFIIKEVAILFELGLDKECDKVITVIAPIEDRIERSIKRDSCSREDVLKRIENQLDDAIKISKSDFVINNISLEQTEEVVKHIINILNGK
jgi:dephospho-CoA kinase